MKRNIFLAAALTAAACVLYLVVRNKKRIKRYMEKSMLDPFERELLFELRDRGSVYTEDFLPDIAYDITGEVDEEEAFFHTLISEMEHVLDALAEKGAVCLTEDTHGNRRIVSITDRGRRMLLDASGGIPSVFSL